MSPGILKWYKRRCFFNVILFGIISLFLWDGPGHTQSLPYPDFTIHKLSSQNPGKTVLIVGGIQGDEPGGFNAASLIATHYKIESGNVWVVPNLNFLSIIKRSRGVFGDLNRKFDKLPIDDPEYKTIQRIKKLITDPNVDLVLNLHDGSGFFRHQYRDKLHNPNRWGQCVIIDQNFMPHDTFPALSAIAQETADHVNRNLIRKNEFYLVNNTRTGQGNEEMAKTLTWFAIKNGKPAFGIEASKSFLTPKRTYYHLTAVEAFLHQAGIKFSRPFTLSEQNIKQAIDEDIQVALNHQKILLRIENVRKHLNFIPLKKNARIEFTVNNPLMTIIESGDTFCVLHGNRRMTHLSPQYLDYDFSINAIEVVVDGQLQQVPFGHVIPVKEWFRVQPIENHRVNIIGFAREGFENEHDVAVRKDQILKHFSIDKDGTLFRVEVYNDKKFSGMVLVDFSQKSNRNIKVAMKNLTREPNGRKNPSYN